jgi:hypothetical protein
VVKVRRVLTESKIERLCREVPDDVGCVATPEREKTLFSVCASECVSDTLVRRGETALLDLADTCKHRDTTERQMRVTISS